VATFEQTSFAFAGPSDRASRITKEIYRKAEAPRVSPRVLPPLDDELARQRLERRIAGHLPHGRLALAITDNRYTMISVRRDKGRVFRVRLHHMFVDAPPLVARALARYIALNDADASRELGRHIEENQIVIRRASSRRPTPITVETRGNIFDLQEIFADLNSRYFGEQIDARITWGPRGGRRRRRTSIKMGSYSVEDRLIRIHPALDRRWVPRFFLEWIVYHEMLHQKHHIPVVGGRRQFHTPEFMAEEATFEHFDRARRWERENLDRLLFY
jgi:hypothetical protein